MRPIFTIHAGEYLVGEFIQRSFPNLKIWIPAKDTGVDLLVTNNDASKAVTLQVKLSKDHRPPFAHNAFEQARLAGGWLTLSHRGIATSGAKYWVIILVDYDRREPEYLIIPPADLLACLVAVHGEREKYQFYPWVMRDGTVLEGRGLNPAEQAQLAEGQLEIGPRNLTRFLNKWSALEKLSID